IPPNMVQQSDGFSVGDPDPSSPSPLAWFLPASPDFIESVGLSLLDGRTFRESDNATSEPVAIINRTLKDFYFRDQDVVGLSITVSGVRRTIIGVVGDTKYDGLAAPSGFQIYVPLSQRPFPGLHVAVRTKVEPASLIGAVREAVLSVDPESPPTRLRTMRQTMAASVNEPRFYTLLLGGFAAAARLFAACGLLLCDLVLCFETDPRNRCQSSARGEPSNGDMDGLERGVESHRSRSGPRDRIGNVAVTFSEQSTVRSASNRSRDVFNRRGSLGF